MSVNNLPDSIKILMVPQMDIIYKTFLEIMESDKNIDYTNWKGYQDKQTTLDWLKYEMIPFYESFEQYEKCNEIQKIIQVLEM